LQLRRRILHGYQVLVIITVKEGRGREGKGREEMREAGYSRHGTSGEVELRGGDNEARPLG